MLRKERPHPPQKKENVPQKTRKDNHKKSDRKRRMDPHASVTDSVQENNQQTTNPPPSSSPWLNTRSLGIVPLAGRFLCGFCQTTCQEPRLLSCKHLVCRSCLQQRRTTNESAALEESPLACPVCSSAIAVGSSSHMPAPSLSLAIQLLHTQTHASESATCETQPTGSGIDVALLEKAKSGIGASLHRANAREGFLTRAVDVLCQSETLLTERCAQAEGDVNALFDRLLQALQTRREHLLEELREKHMAKAAALQEQKMQLQSVIKDMKWSISTAEVIQKYASETDFVRIRDDLCQELDLAGRASIPLEPTEKIDVSLQSAYEVENEANMEDIFTKFGQLRWNYADVTKMKSGLKKRGSVNSLQQCEIKEISTITARFGGKGTKFGRLNHPYRVAVDFNTGFIIVSDSDNNRIQIYQPDGTPIRMFGTQGDGDENFLFPRGVAVDDESRIAVTDQWNHRVHITNIDGSFICTFGSKGVDPGQFNEPYGVAFDQHGYLLVADSDNHRIQVLSIEGTFIRMFGRKGTGPGEFRHPSGITVDDSGRILVSDTLNHRIQIFSAEGTFIQAFGKKGSGTSEFIFPEGIDTDSKGNLFVTDAGNNRIQVFSPNGEFIHVFGNTGPQDTKLLQPTGIALDSNDRIYVADHKNNRIIVY